MSENKEHLTQEEFNLLGDLIKSQMRVINKIQHTILAGEVGAKDSAYIDNCGRIGHLINGLGHLICFRSGSTIDWENSEKKEQQEQDPLFYPPVD